MNDLKTVRDALERVKAFIGQMIVIRGYGQEQYSDICTSLATLDRMIETLAPQGWSAIETAPKNGTEILLALWSGHPEHKTSFCWAINGHYKDGFFYSKDPMIGKLASPTHWQHITAPTPAPTEKVERIEGLCEAITIVKLAAAKGLVHPVEKTNEGRVFYQAAKAYLKLQSATQED